MVESSVRPTVLVLVFSNLAMDARVVREVRRLRERFDVTSASFGQSPIDGVPHIELPDLPPYQGGLFTRLGYIASFVLGRFATIVERNPRDRAALEMLGDREWDVVIANDTDTLPLATSLRARAGVLADLHEYAPKQADESLLFRLTTGRYFRWILRRFLPKVARVTTVSRGIADEYQREFGVEAEVVTNAAGYVAGEVGEVGDPIRIVHSAAPSPARRIEVMIEGVRDSTTDVTLDLYLVDDGSIYLDSLRALASTTPRVTIHPPVPNSQLVEVLSEHDLGVHLLPPINFNHRWALPNKLFDYVQARLGVIIGPSPEMARVVNEHGLGAITDDFTAASLTRVLDGLDRTQVAEWKTASHHAALPLSGESQLDILESVVQSMVEERARREPT